MTITVECLVVPGCPNCAGSLTSLREVATAVDPGNVTWREIDLIEEMDYAIELGVVGASALAIDGDLVFPTLPKPEALRSELLKRLESHSGSGLAQ